MKTAWFNVILVGVLSVLMVQCSQVETGEGPSSGLNESSGLESKAEPAEPDQDNPMDESNSSLENSGMQTLVDAARADLAKRLSIPGAQIELVEAKSVVWPDSALGCPQPGMEYKQVPEDGTLIVLRAQGLEYEYHTGGSRGLFLCEKGLSKPEKPPQIDILQLTPSSPDKYNATPSTPEEGIPPGEDQ